MQSSPTPVKLPSAGPSTLNLPAATQVAALSPPPNPFAAEPPPAAAAAALNTATATPAAAAAALNTATANPIAPPPAAPPIAAAEPNPPAAAVSASSPGPQYFYVDSDPPEVNTLGTACTIVLNDPKQITKNKDGKYMSAGPFLQGTLGKCDATDPLNVSSCTVVETGTAGRTFTNTGTTTTFMFKREPVPASDLPTVVPAVSPAAAVSNAADAAVSPAAAVSNAADAAVSPDEQVVDNADADANPDADDDAAAAAAAAEQGKQGEQQSPSLSSSPSSPNPSPKQLEPGVSCGATLPLDDLPDSCSSDAPPPPLKAYILSILSPILEEYADALFQTLRVKPYQLAESAVSDAVIAQAISPEVLERMKALNDPAVQQVLADFKANVRKAVQQSGEMLQNGVGDNIGNLLGDIGRKLSSAIQLLIADLPGVGVFMAGAQLADTAVNAAKQGEQIVNEAEQALQPLNAVQAQVGKVKDAVDEATNNLPLGKNQEGDIEMTGLGPNLGPNPESGEAESGEAASETTGLGESAATGEVSETTGLGEAESGKVSGASAASPSAAAESAPALGNRTTPARQVSENPKETAAREKEEDSRLGGGGSRKRRRIHKLSRRIERTLRRVQKKYGLQGNQGNQSNQGKQDKNGFLRRTLRHRKP